MDRELNVSDFPIGKYAGYFHDGGMHKILHNDDTVELWMESAELLPEWNKDNIPLSKRNTITGKLLLLGAKEIYEDKKRYAEKFKIRDSYVDADIYTFRISPNNVMLQIWWNKYEPEYEESKTYEYIISAEEIIWENDLTLIDSWWEFDDEE